MSNRTQSLPQDKSPKASAPPMTKEQRRAAGKAARTKAVAARRRRQRLARLLPGLTGLTVVIVIVAAVLIFGDSGSPDATGDNTSTSTGDTSFPPLPAGADPALKNKPTTSAGSGELTKLTVTPLIEGTGPAAQAGQQITVNYVGVSYQTGAEFDASWNRSQPFAFVLGNSEVIDGWDQGLVGIKLGSRVQLDIPTELAYGNNPRPGQPAGALRFIVDVLALN